MKNIAVIGSGYWGKNLVRNFHELGVLKTICDLNETTLKEFQERYPQIHITTSFQEVLDDKDIKGVVIATPAVLHYQMTKDTLEHGKDVFVEKPLSLNLSEAKNLIEISEENNCILMVGHILHYHPAVVKLKELIQNGYLGKIQYIYSNRLNLGKFRTEENILWSFAPHDVSIILMLLDEMPSNISSHAGTYLNKDVADVTLTTMDFSSGVKSHIFVSWLHPYKEQKLVIVGSQRMAVFNDLDEKKLTIYPHEIDWVDRVPIPQLKDPEPVEIKTDEPLKEECKHFLNCIETRKKPKTDGNEGYRVLQILHASQESLENNAKNINLEEKGYFIHQSSIIDEPCEIGNKTKIWHFSHILPGSKIGNNCNIGQNVMIGPDVAIGNNVKVQNNVSIYKGVRIEDDVFLGPSMVFTNVINPRSFISRKNEFQETVVKKGATIGANTTIICGNTIGKYALVGAGAVVTEDVPDYAIVVGNPARLSNWTCQCGLKLKFNNNLAECKCGYKYQKKDNKVVNL
ncbi:Inositol 2-dehydrogenase/D-chiro-inositol 3-dehydrogenase [anaerobic digester metagenome]|jgi:UDP-2-acetamido-3-amino-2,3-dideoxy-glucuronate N-acetyltransferase|nr:MAG: oxidoreductase [Methanobacteriales archaeon HGW-Methanobacteriales-2]